MKNQLFRGAIFMLVVNAITSAAHAWEYDYSVRVINIGPSAIQAPQVVAVLDLHNLNSLLADPTVQEAQNPLFSVQFAVTEDNQYPHTISANLPQEIFQRVSAIKSQQQTQTKSYLLNSDQNGQKIMVSYFPKHPPKNAPSLRIKYVKPISKMTPIESQGFARYHVAAEINNHEQAHFQGIKAASSVDFFFDISGF